MGNSQTMSCASGEKSSKAQQKEERYSKKPMENGDNGVANGNGHGDAGTAGEVVASSEISVTKEETVNAECTGASGQQQSAAAEHCDNEVKEDVCTSQKQSSTECAPSSPEESSVATPATPSTAENAEHATATAEVEVSISEPNEGEDGAGSAETNGHNVTGDTSPGAPGDSLSQEVMASVHGEGSNLVTAEASKQNGINGMTDEDEEERTAEVSIVISKAPQESTDEQEAE